MNAKQNQQIMKRLAATMVEVPEISITPISLLSKMKESELEIQLPMVLKASFEKISEPKILDQFLELYCINSDIIGWINIENTNINYPVMYTPEDEEFYLHRNFKKEPEKRGLPFVDGKTDIEISQNYLIYGHNMKDGTVFHDLLKYIEESYYKEHPIIRFNTLYENADYEIMAVFQSQIYYENQEIFKYYKYMNTLDELEYQEYVKNVKKLSLYDTGVTASFGEKLLTLSTCSYHTTDGRFVLVAKKK